MVHSIVYYQMHLYCVFMDPKVKIMISIGTGTIFFHNRAAIKQLAIVEKEPVKVCFFHFLFPLFMFWLGFKAYGDDLHVLWDAEETVKY